MTESLKLASIDIGTNSTRLLIAECDGTRTKTIDRRMVITRLGEGVDRTKRLSRAAIERTSAALSDYADIMERLRPADLRAAATSVLRDCVNGADFLDSAGRIIGRAPMILSGEEEARLSYLGAVSDLPLDADTRSGGCLVFDIGGGSTEIMVGESAAISPPGGAVASGAGLEVASVNVGCVRMSERFLSESDPPSRLSLESMEAHIEGELRPVLETLLTGRLSCSVGLAGTVTTLSGIKQGLTRYETEKIHHSRLTLPEVDWMYEKLAAVPVDERRTVMGLEPGRADVIVGGTAVLLVLMRLAGLQEILVSEKDILDGLVIDLFGRIQRA